MERARECRYLQGLLLLVMRLIGLPQRLRIGFALALFLAHSAMADVPPVLMVHPLFGNQFCLPELQFPRVSSAVVRSLKLRPGQYWQFAAFSDRFDGNAKRYILIAGIPVPESGMTAEPDFGAMILFEKGRYLIVGSADDLAIVGKFSPQVQHGIYESAVDGVVRAFGGVVRARTALCRQKITVGVVGADLYAIMSRRGLVCRDA